jgi:hypothetical protein
MLRYDYQPRVCNPQFVLARELSRADYHQSN